MAADPAREDWGLVFANELGALRVTRRFQRLLEQAGLPRLRFHDLRHASATVRLALGVDARTIMETLGHSQVSVTMNVYAGVIDELKETASEAAGRSRFQRVSAGLLSIGRYGSRPIAKTRIMTGVPGWRNWQTQRA